ncbi:acyl transferase 15-like [Panicum virgatum]|uniref:Uncharacterized protein n=1 Tax=Panicum virgatum TaxID=38727 RepID=A0A8T0P6T8_PANVG|nr:acyl transferase 15-like [Panicum virgatum]KAG2556389.1 hypothetical protein PVAP13_8NG081500 [Panicum virgatum]
MVGVAVRRSPSVVVRPSELTAATSGGAIIKLTPFDRLSAKLPVTALLAFEHPIREAAETIKRALSRALVPYYPISGRIVAGSGGGGDDEEEVHIRCSGEGVAFVAASANCALKDAEFFARSPDTRTPPPLLDELAVDYPAECCAPADPLLLMQVTEFSCGGFVVAVTWNHGVADGIGMAQFFEAVGELARGSPSPSLAPVRWDDSLSLPPPNVQLVSPEPMGLVYLDITVTSSSIDRIRAEFHERSNNGRRRTCTVFEAVAAVLWQCRTRAIASRPDSLALLSFAANVRSHVNAKDGYYGNCLATQTVTATAGTVANADVTDLVDTIKRAKDGVQDKLFAKNDDDLLQAMDKSQLDKLRYSALFLTSWRNLGFEKVDFGGGTLERVMCRLPGPWIRTWPTCVVCLPCKEKDAPNIVLSACVKEEHVDAFLAELARFT